MKNRSMDGAGLLSLYDRITGVFNEIFDQRLLSVAIGALMGYCTLFTQRKMPLRWMVFVLFGMVLLTFVTLTARTPGRVRARFRVQMPLAWFALHGMMVVSGLFYEDWLPESVPLLLCYPVIFSVFSSRDDDDTFRCVLRGALLGTMPFLLLTWIRVPLRFGYPGYRGIFYDANPLAMACIVAATSGFLLAYAAFRERRRGSGVVCLLCGISASVTLLATMSRSGLLAFAGVAFLLIASIAAGSVRHPARIVALMLALLVLLGVLGWRFTLKKIDEAAREDYALALYNHETYGNPITVPRPEERALSMDDLTSDRWGIWMSVLNNLTWNGHPTSVVREWVAQDGAGDRHFNAHNAFLGVGYNNGWIAGVLLVLYAALSVFYALSYYWHRRHTSALAATPLAFATIFVLVGLFESVYAPFSLIGCAYLLVQAPLWRVPEGA